MIFYNTGGSDPERIRIRLDPADPHWVRLNDPDKTARELDGWWENNATIGQKRATIDIKISEVKNRGGTARIRWWSNDWFNFELGKSVDGKGFEKLWQKIGYKHLDKTYEIELDPWCEYYRIYFTDGDLAYEKTRVHKDVRVSIAAVAPTPTPTPTPRITPTPTPMPPGVTPTPAPTLSICEWLEEAKIKTLTTKHALWIYYLSQGWDTLAGLIKEKISPTPPNLAEDDQTLDNALGIYYYSKNWKELGNRKTGCTF